MRFRVITLARASGAVYYSLGAKADTNIALTAAASLLWIASDAIQAKRMEPRVVDVLAVGGAGTVYRREA